MGEILIKKILIVKLGSTYKFLSEKYGDFEDWIRADLRVTRQEIVVVDAQERSELPEPTAFKGIILTGSHATIMDHEEWSERTARWLSTIAKHNIPLLGICYGHQLLAHALGGKVDNNPKGREFGTVNIELSESAASDQLFKNMPKQFFVHAGHTQSVVLLPLSAQRLASSEKDANMAFFYPPCCWGVQFHPEYNEAIIAGYISEAALMLKSEGQDVNELLKNIQATSDCNQLLINFLRIISDQANPIAKKLLT